MIPEIKELNLPEYATLSNATVSLADMGDKTISTQLKIDGDVKPDFSHDWAVEFRGEKYIFALREPQASKDNSSLKAIYDLTFGHYAIDLMKRRYFVQLNTKNDVSPIVDQYVAPINLNLGDFVKHFAENLKFHYGDIITIDLNPAWQYELKETYVEISYSYMWDILQKFYELYSVRWVIEPIDIDHYVIKVGYPAVEISHIFEYGYEGGLLKFERQIQDGNIKNLLLGRGGGQNLPYRYFKNVDPNNPQFAGDPDAIPELATTSFTELRPKTFRDYVQGWKANHGGTYEPNRGYAYEKGYSDVTFKPVEYVKNDDSIAKYGELWGGLDNNETIYPTIQGIEVDGIGRVDEVVAVEKVTTDKVEESVIGGSVLYNIKPFSITNTMAFNDKLDFLFESEVLDVKIDGSNIDLGNISYTVVSHVGTYFDINNAIKIHNKYIRLIRYSDNVMVSDTNIPSGKYYVKCYSEIEFIYHDEDASEYPNFNVTASCNNTKLIAGSIKQDTWKPTFDIWIKNVWGTTKGIAESDVSYVSRVWDNILGDRAGEEAKVAFSKGLLSIADYDFIIVKDGVHYDTSKFLNGVPSEWRLTLKKSDAEAEATGEYIPNTYVNAISGDTFYFLGIDMPHQYVLWAEERVDDWKRDALLETSKSNPTWILQLDKIRSNELQEQSKSMIDLLNSGVMLRSTDSRFVTDAAYLQLYAQSVSFKWADGTLGLIPDVEVVLTDKIIPVLNPVTQIKGEVDSLKSQFIGLSNIEQIVRSVGDKLYLRKDGIADRSISPTQFAGLVTGTKWRQGDVGGADWGIYRDDQGNAIIEADTFVARKDFRANNFVINQITAQGGKQIESAAVIECTRVDDTPSGYVCYFDQKQGSIGNLFKVDDVAYSQVYDPMNIVISQYKRRVTAVGIDNITLSKTYVNGSGIPKVGDVIVHYGNYTDPNRQYIIVRDVIGGGYERMIMGLNSVTSNGVEYYFAGYQTGKGIRWFVGNDQKNIEFVNGDMYVRAKLSIGSGSSGLGNIDEWAAAEDTINNAQSTANDAVRANQAVNDYVQALESDVNAELVAVNKRLDGVIENHFELYDPTLNNYPANEWTTEKLKEDHNGDTFTNKTTGNSWKWKIIGGTWKWDEITDTFEKELLNKIAKAQATADGKIRNFVFEPYPPYAVGDTWTQGSGGDMMRCIRSRTSGVFTAADWDKASKYTDDTVAKEAKAAASAAQATANDGLKTAKAATTKLTEWGSDSVIAPVEKPALRQQHNDVKSEYKEVLADAAKYAVSTTAYTTAYNAANAAFVKYTATTPESIAVGSDYAAIATYYTARQTILEAIAAAAKAYSEKLVDDVQFGGVNLVPTAKEILMPASTASSHFYTYRLDEQLQGGDVVTIHIDSIKLISGTATKFRIALYDKNLIDAFFIKDVDVNDHTWTTTIPSWVVKQDAALLLYAGVWGATAGNSVQYTGVTLVRGNKPMLSWSPSASRTKADIDKVNASAEKANNALADMANDLKFTPQEKAEQRDVYAQMALDYKSYQANATTYGISLTSVTGAYNNLRTYLTTVAKINDKETTTTITAAQGTTYDQYRSAWKTSVEDFANTISKKLVDDVQFGGVNLALGSASVNAAITQTTPKEVMGAPHLKNLVPGETYMVSFDAKYVSGTGVLHCELHGNKGGDVQIKTTGGCDRYGLPTTLAASATSADKRLWCWLPAAGRIDIKNIKVEMGTKFTSYSPAPEDVQADIDRANALLADIAADDKLTPDEKQDARKEWGIIASEYPVVLSQANKYNIPTTGYTAAKDALGAYLTPLFADLTATSDIVGSTFRAKFASYYDAKAMLLRDVSNATWEYTATTSDYRASGTIDASGLDPDTYYPVTFLTWGGSRRSSFEVYATLGADTGIPPWASHGAGFSCACQWSACGSAWGARDVQRVVNDYQYGWVRDSDFPPIGSVGQMTNSSNEYIYVRGGGKYRYRSTFSEHPVLHTSPFTASGETIGLRSSVVKMVSVNDGLGAMKYLKSAFPDTFTEIEGGVVLSTFMGVRNSGGYVVAGMAGKNFLTGADFTATDETCPMIFAGNSGAVTNVQRSKYRVYPTGKVYMSQLEADAGCKLFGSLKLDTGLSSNALPGIWYKSPNFGVSNKPYQYTFWSESRIGAAAHSPNGDKFDLTIYPNAVEFPNTSGNDRNRAYSVMVSTNGLNYGGILFNCASAPAIYMQDGYIAGMRQKGRTTTVNTTLTDMDNTLLCLNGSAITVTLPSSPKLGQKYTIHNLGSGNLNVYCFGKKIERLGHTPSNSFLLTPDYKGKLTLEYISGYSNWIACWHSNV